MLAATQKAEQQRALVEEFKTKINSDLARAKQDGQELEKYEASLKTRLATVQNELSQLYRANKALGRELAHRWRYAELAIAEHALRRSPPHVALGFSPQVPAR